MSDTRHEAITAAMCAGGVGLGDCRLSADGTAALVVVSDGADTRFERRSTADGSGTVLACEPPPRRARTTGSGVFDWHRASDTIAYLGATGGVWLRRSDDPSVSVVASERGSIASPTFSPDGRRIAYVVDDRTIEIVDLAGPDATDPVRQRLVLPNGADFRVDPAWSPDGRRLVWHEWDVPAMAWDESRIASVTFDEHGGSAAIEMLCAGDDVSYGVPRFSPDGTMLAFLSDGTGWLTVWLAEEDGKNARALRHDEAEHASPTWGPGQRPFAWSPDGASIVHTRNEDGFGALRVVDVASGVAETISRGVHGCLDWRGDTIVATRSGGRTPTQVAAFAAGPVGSRTGAADGGGVDEVPLRKAPRSLVMDAGFDGFEPFLAEPELVGWKAPDGLDLNGRLYRAPDAARGPLPLIVWLHGGPSDQWMVDFRPRIPYFASRGWAVLVPDHRGSSGHGRSFIQALRGRWCADDVTDVISGLEASVTNGWGDADKLVVMGSSSGGATVLNVLATRPGLCAAGVDLFGVVDLDDTTERTHRFEAHYFDSLVGPRSIWKDRSPAGRIAAIADPLLVLHGSDDPVVPVEQSIQLVEDLAAAGKPVESHIYEGEGHGWGRPEVTIDEIGRIDDFLSRHVLSL